jgi:hypothetical protein
MIDGLRSLIVLIACSGALITGCGGGAGSSSSSSAPAASSSTTKSVGSGSANPAISKAVAVCKASVDSQTSISSTIKTKLYNICDEAGAGNQAAVKKATADVCIEVIKETVPAADQAAAEANCPKA